jgi:hypothetical protein
MAVGDRRQKGLDTFNEVYAGKLPAPPPGVLGKVQGLLG